MDTKSPPRLRSLADYACLGRSGLRVSPLCLGTMTFGTEWGWGSEPDVARAVLRRYLEAGGNFVDTADGYTGGRSEELLGGFLREGGLRDGVVLATKFTFNAVPGDPNAGGNGRKNVHRALEGSLRRLGTDRVDLYWLHAWDTVTPVEEVVSTMDALVRAGRVLHYGFSDVPAWYFARARTLAEAHGMEPPCALQLEYSLAERSIEREHVPAALHLGAGICPWSPLSGGLLTGKYRRTAAGWEGAGRLDRTRDSQNPTLRRFTDRNARIVDALLAAAKEAGRSPAQTALGWVARRPGVVSTILGATTVAQLEDNLRSLEAELPAEVLRALDEASRPEPAHPYVFFEGVLRDAIFGGVPVRAEPRWYRPG